MSGLAQFSPCRKYRYTLWRQFPGDFLINGGNHMKPGYVAWVCLNPSTADDVVNDPTIRRCIDFTQRFGYGQMCMLNLFAWRETDSSLLKTIHDPVGEHNTEYIVKVTAGAALVIAAWGTKGTMGGRDLTVKKLVPKLMCLKHTGAGHPQHPLYLPKTLTPIPL